MDRKGKYQAKVKINQKALPMPMLDNPTIIDRQTVNFYDDSEERFLQRELLRKKLRKVESGGKADPDIIVPEASDLEKATRRHYKTLSELSQGGEKEKLEIRLLKKMFNSHSLVNIATKLAEAELIETEKNYLKKYWTTGPLKRVPYVKPPILPEEGAAGATAGDEH